MYNCAKNDPFQRKAIQKVDTVLEEKQKRDICSLRKRANLTPIVQKPKTVQQ